MNKNFKAHFRRYKKNNHPALIESERNSKEYNFYKISHSPGEKGKKYIKISPNPNKRDKRAMYINPKRKHNKKIYFSEPFNWSIIKKIQKFLNDKKK